MHESRLQYEIICAEVRCAKVPTTSQFIWRFIWRRPDSPRLEDRADDGAENDRCTNTSQVGVVKTIYYPRRGIYL